MSTANPSGDGGRTAVKSDVGNPINATRQLNRDALHEKQISIADLSGFQLPSDVTEEFLTRMQTSIPLLDMVDTMTLDRLEQEVPQFGVPRLSGATRNEEASRTSSVSATSGHVKFNVTDRNYYILVEPRRDALKNTHFGPDNFGEYIIDQFIQRWANDVALIGMRANAASGNLNTYASFAAGDSTWEGWIARAEGDSDSTRIGLEDTAGGELSTMPTVDWASAAIDTQLFNDAIQQLDSRYRDPDRAVFLTSPDQVQQYAFDLTNREDVGGVAVLMGDGNVTPFDYDVIGIPEWPNSYAMLTDPQNLAYGLYETMEMDQTQSSDTVFEDRLHSRTWLEGQFDFQIKQMQAGVLVTNISDPTA